MFVRIFKREFELELWMMRDGRFHRFATYPICKWSGQLGPKLATGDHQAPEGFYTVDETQLNPNSRWHRSFNLGFPNAFDKAHGRTGSFLMVHGGCGSVGCYAMTNGVIDEVWKLVTAALRGGQKRFQVQVLPFRLTDEALSSHGGYPEGQVLAEPQARLRPVRGRARSAQGQRLRWTLCRSRRAGAGLTGAPLSRRAALRSLASEPGQPPRRASSARTQPLVIPILYQHSAWWRKRAGDETTYVYVYCIG